MKTNHAVVIAGAGPTGLMLAAELALAKVDVALVERRATQELSGARAGSGGLHARTLEVLDQRGVVERFLTAGKVMQVTGYAMNRLDISDFPTRHNYGLALWQKHSERILAEWVEELGVPIRRGCEVVDFVQSDAHVDVRLDTGEAVRTRYLVGCDGGRSAIRKKAGIGFPGWEPSGSFLHAECEMTEEPAWGLRRDAKGIYALGKLEDGKVGVVLREDYTGQTDDPTLDELRAALVELYGTHFGLSRATWISRFTDGTRQADKYRDRRVLLAGDAAHVHPPMGGQGLNIGVQDAVNLGWKLARVVHGTSAETLLDTYHSERHPVGARVLQNTMAQAALGRGGPQMDAVRETLADLLKMDEPRKRIAGMMSGLDVHYALGEGHPLVGRRMPDLDLVTDTGMRRVYELLHAAEPVLLVLDSGRYEIGNRVPVMRATYTGPWELPVLGSVSGPTAVLVRPDGYVAWVGEGTEDGLEEALLRWFTPESSSTKEHA